MPKLNLKTVELNHYGNMELVDYSNNSYVVIGSKLYRKKENQKIFINELEVEQLLDIEVELMCKLLF